MDLEGKGHIIANGHGVKQGCILKADSEILADGIHLVFPHSADILTIDTDHAGIGFYQTENILEQHALAGTAGPQDYGYLAGRHVQVHPAKHLHPLKGFM